MIKIWLYVLWFKPKPPGPLASKCNEWNCDFILTRLKMYWCKMIRNTIITLWVVVTLGGPDHVQVNWRCKSIFLDSILLFFYFGRWFSVKNQISTFGLPSLLAYTYIPKNREKRNLNNFSFQNAICLEYILGYILIR